MTARDLPRTPGRRRPAARRSGSDALEYEILQAKAETLGRLGRGLEDALAALRALDDAGAAPDGAAPSSRERLLARAGEAAYFYLIQRELMGLRADGLVLDEIGVPGEVRRRMSLDPERSAS